MRGLKLISEEALIQVDVGFFVSARAGDWPEAGPRSNVQNKAHNLVLVLIIYCLRMAHPRRLRLSLQALAGLQMRKRR